MTRNFACVSPSYMGLYRVYCFKALYTCGGYENVKRYEEGDFIPIASNSYIYNKNLLIVDFANYVVHIIESYRYKKTVKILGDVDSRVYKYFKSRAYMSIDIYGNMLNVSNIYDLYRVMNLYPSINIYLEERKFLKTNVYMDARNNGFENEAIIVLNNLNNYKDNGIVLSGYTFTVRYRKQKSTLNSFELANKLYEQVAPPILNNFEDEFFDRESIYSKVNTLLDLFNINYVLELNKNGKIITYFTGTKKKITHIDRLKKDIKSFIDENEENELNFILDIIFANVVDEEYAEYIIETISTILDIND